MLLLLYCFLLFAGLNDDVESLGRRVLSSTELFSTIFGSLESGERALSKLDCFQLFAKYVIFRAPYLELYRTVFDDFWVVRKRRVSALKRHQKSSKMVR